MKSVPYLSKTNINHSDYLHVMASLPYNGTVHFKNVNNFLNTNLYTYIETSVGKSYNH